MAIKQAEAAIDQATVEVYRESDRQFTGKARLVRMVNIEVVFKPNPLSWQVSSISRRNNTPFLLFGGKSAGNDVIPLIFPEPFAALVRNLNRVGLFTELRPKEFTPLKVSGIEQWNGACLGLHPKVSFEAKIDDWSCRDG